MGSSRPPNPQGAPEGPGRDERFARAHRLRQRRQYRATYEHGRRAHGRLVVVFGLAREDAEPWRLGLTATRRVGKAVCRNRLRRLGREIFRHWGGQLPEGWDIVVNFKHSAVGASQAELRADMRRCLARLGVLEAEAGEDGTEPNA